ncbi:iron complex transport system substrate-binding protein [Paenibacillus tianmuensis]|uniref:Iron complex transport system substrate-binding protein n=1 Tax=Paenibacillus tianmuensis TaxID=624147 RepID=A0A1G4Q9Q9_9BACL|nr:ABC transporter substrate-binding protein [Paenibacillus tianmuensis]SCW41344.1 iron complex transport system substrate-binding protein [Paenibacillus tianmuensis]
MISFRKGIAGFMLIAMALALFGCGGSTGSGADSGVTAAQSGQAGKSPEAQTRKVKDAKGEVEIPARPLRIADVSGSTEELLVLSFQPIATGNTEMGNPKELTPILKQKLKADTIKTGWFQTEVSVEAIASANPDLIFAGPTQDKIYDQLSKIAPTVRVPYGFNAFRKRFAFVAGVLDRTKEMEAWMKAYDEQAKRLREKITAVTKDETFAVIEATAKEIRIYSKTGVADMIFRDMQLPQAPGTPEPDPWGGKVTSLEGLSNLNPDHLILLTASENNVLQESKLWSGLKAVKNGRVYRLTSKQNYNEAFYALGKKALLEQLGNDIVQKAH